MEVKQVVSSSGHTNQREHPQLSLNTSAGNKDMHAWCCEAEYSQQSTQGPLFWFQDLVNISLSLSLFYNIIYVFTFTLSGSVSHTYCYWLGFLLRRLQWGHSWWRWGSWQSAAVDLPEHQNRNQPHPLLKDGRYHSGRKEENGYELLSLILLTCTDGKNFQGGQTGFQGGGRQMLHPHLKVKPCMMCGEELKGVT